MRPVLHADIVAAARCLLAVAGSERRSLANRLIARASLADVYRKATGKVHPLWGNGCLESAAVRSRQAPEPFLDDPDYCGCMVEVFEAVISARQPAGGRNNSCSEPFTAAK